MSEQGTVTTPPEIPGWRHIYSGKVRELYVPDESRLRATGVAIYDDAEYRAGSVLVLATDRISAFDVALAYAKERQAFGGAILDQQAVGFRLAECATRIEAARQLTWHAAALRDAGRPCLKEAAMAKLFASEMAEQVCSAAIQTLGGYGYVNDFPLERIYRDVRVCQIYEGTSDIQKLLIQRALTA